MVWYYNGFGDSLNFIIEIIYNISDCFSFWLVVLLFLIRIFLLSIDLV